MQLAQRVCLSYTDLSLLEEFDVMKLDPKAIEEAVLKLKEALPNDVGEFKRLSEEKLKLALEGLLQRMDMVTREEYEVQTEVLRRTRERVEQLEQRISIFEQK